jgi:hypothetical protein
MAPLFIAGGLLQPAGRADPDLQLHPGGAVARQAADEIAHLDAKPLSWTASLPVRNVASGLSAE